MKARYLLIFALALITLVGIIPAGCTSTPDMGGLTAPVTLSNADKDRAAAIAGNTPEMQPWLAKETASTVDYRWLAIKWEDGVFSAFRSIDLDWENDPNYALVPEGYRWYPAVITTFGDPSNWQVTVAVDLGLDKAVYVVENPLNRGPQPQPTTEISPAPIHDVQVNIAESFPPQVFLYIKGGLRDGCTTYRDDTIERSSNTINVEVTVQRPTDQICPAVYTFFERNLALGTDFTSGEEYTVNVNDYTTTFVMP